MPTAYEKAFPCYGDYIKMQTLPGKDPYDIELIRTHLRYLEYFLSVCSVPRSAAILEIGCNTGHAIRAWKVLDYRDIFGIDINQENIRVCADLGLFAAASDAHDISFLAANCADVVYSTHAFEHMYSPSKVVRECFRVLKPGGYLLVVLPYPDGDSPGHLGSVELGTCQAPNMAHSMPYDEGAAVTRFFEEHGFTVLSKKYDTHREPEIWMALQKEGAE